MKEKIKQQVNEIIGNKIDKMEKAEYFEITIKKSGNTYHCKGGEDIRIKSD